MNSIAARKTMTMTAIIERYPLIILSFASITWIPWTIYTHTYVDEFHNFYNLTTL